MKKLLVFFLILVLAAVTVFAFQSHKVRDQVNDVSDAVADAVSPEHQVMVAQGTAISIRLQNRLGTGISHVGDPFRGTVSQSVWIGDKVVIPSGSEVTGHVVQAQAAGHVSGHGALQLAYDELIIGSDHIALATRGETYQTGSSAKRSAALIGGGAVVGGVVGGVAGKSSGSAAKGAVIGGLAGTAASLASPRPELTLEPESQLTFRLDQPIGVQVRPA